MQGIFRKENTDKALKYGIYRHLPTYEKIIRNLVSFYEKNALADFHTEKYLNRIVTSANQLVEKIQIFDAGKDDRIMELVKLLATDSILKNDPDKEFDELRFAVDDDGTNILVIINKGEITGAVDIDNMYEFASSHCDDFKDFRDDEDIVINQEWILNKLAEVV